MSFYSSEWKSSKSKNGSNEGSSYPKARFNRTPAPSIVVLLFRVTLTSRFFDIYFLFCHVFTYNGSTKLIKNTNKKY